MKQRLCSDEPSSDGRWCSSSRAAKSAMVAGLWLSAGCGAAWRPPLPQPAASDVPTVHALSAYLPHGPGREWLYYRSAHSRTLRPEEVEYRRVVEPAAMAEGRVIGRPQLLLAEILQPRGDRSLEPAAVEAMATLLDGGAGFFVQFDPPLRLFPRMLAVNDTVEAQSALRYYDRFARPADKGSVTRRITCEGIEPAVTPAGTFDECIRLRIEMQFRLGWGPSVSTVEYVWLARGVGEVRRIEHIAGWLWFLLFESTTEYRLVSHQPGSDTSGINPGASLTDVAVSNAALLFARALPKPLIGGIRFEISEAAGNAPVQTGAYEYVRSVDVH